MPFLQILVRRRLTVDKTEILKAGAITEIMSFELKANNSEEENPDIFNLPALSENIRLEGKKGSYSLIRELTDKTGEAIIYLACDLDSGKNYVAKLYRADIRPKPAVVDFLMKTDFENIIKLIDYGDYGNKCFEIYRYYDNGDLSKNVPLPHDFIRNTVIPGVIEGLRLIHENNIIHRDIKPNNLFLNDDKTKVVIGDFGISSTSDSDLNAAITQTMKFTFGYAAPECLSNYKGNSILTREGDYYSFGITLFFLLTGRELFEGMPAMQIFLKTMSGDLPIIDGYNTEIERLVRGLTRIDPKARWGYQKVKKWLDNEFIHEEAFSASPDTFPKPFYFANKPIYSAIELSKEFSTHWEEAIKQLYRGIAGDFLKNINQQLAAKAYDLSDRYRSEQDTGLFKFIYEINPALDVFCWRGMAYASPCELAEAMYDTLPVIDKNFAQILRNGLLSEFIAKKGSADQNDINRLIEIERIALHDEEQAYIRFVYELLKEKRDFIFRGVRFNTTDELIGYLQDNIINIDALSEELGKSKYFRLWLEYLGFKSHVEAWINSFND